jgi:hypothetical protein
MNLLSAGALSAKKGAGGLLRGHVRGPPTIK